MRLKNKMLSLDLITSLLVPKLLFPPSDGTNLLWIICVFPKLLQCIPQTTEAYCLKT